MDAETYRKDIHNLVTLIMGGVIDQSKEEALLQLRKLATDLDKKQRDMDIAKVSFASSGILGSGLAIGGIVAAPFSFGASLGLTVAGVSMGVASGLGGLATVIADQIINSSGMKDAEESIKKYMEKVNELVDMINFFHVSTTDEDEFDAYDILREELNLVPSSEDRIKVETIIRGLKVGMDTGGTAAHIGAAVGAAGVNTAAVAGRSTFAAASAGLEVVRVGGVILSVLTVPLDLHVMVTNSIKINRNTPSEVAEQIRNMANTLEEHQLLDSYEEGA